jgi:protein-S-isoprenylcysteine O-methyltransferase Ste14
MGRRIVIAIFVVLMVATGVSAARAVAHAASDPTTRAWMVAAYVLLKLGVASAFTVAVVRRDPARRRVREPPAYLACATAMIAVVALDRPDASTATGWVVAGESLALVAAAWMLVATLTLGRCFGILPEARGLVTHGPYRFVRHPLYLGEFGTCAGLVIASPSGRNLLMAASFVLAQTVRMRLEERELTREFPDYRAYAERTPRLVPRVRLAPRATFALRQGELG